MGNYTNNDIGTIAEFDVTENKKFDWSDLVEGNKAVLQAFYPHKISTIKRISGVQTFLVNGCEVIFVGDDHLSLLGIQHQAGTA